jgi:LacI family transcriptional regulator
MATFPPKAPTLAEIARSAGVSTATVSRVLKSRGYVAEETRARVAKVLRDTRYRPNVMASSLRTQRSFSIGLIVPAITSNPFFVNVAHAVEEEALQHGYKTIIFNHNGDEALERQGIESLLERRMDALLVCNATTAANVELAIAAGIAVVQIERETSARTSAVIADNHLGAREAMAHLIGLGHRRIAFVGGDPAHNPYHGPQPRSVEEQRLDAYREALAEAGIAVRSDYIRLGRYYDIPEGSGRYGREHMQALLGLEERPTAIFATCDVLAAGVLQALHAAPNPVPHGISVKGFDDTHAANLTPPQTTVAQPVRDMGAEAVRLAMAALGGEAGPRTVTMPTWVVHRASTSTVGPDLDSA